MRAEGQVEARSSQEVDLGFSPGRVRHSTCVSSKEGDMQELAIVAQSLSIYGSDLSLVVSPSHRHDWVCRSALNVPIVLCHLIGSASSFSLSASEQFISPWFTVSTLK